MSWYPAEESEDEKAERLGVPVANLHLSEAAVRNCEWTNCVHRVGDVCCKDKEQRPVSSPVEAFRALLRAKVDATIDVSGDIARQEAQIDEADHLLVKFNELFPEASLSVPDWMIDTPAASVDDMAALIRRLVRELRKAAPDNDLSEKALDYLRRHGLNGDILRSPSPD